MVLCLTGLLSFTTLTLATAVRAQDDGPAQDATVAPSGSIAQGPGDATTTQETLATITIRDTTIIPRGALRAAAMMQVMAILKVTRMAVHPMRRILPRALPG
jgi:hypothetical protein